MVKYQTLKENISLLLIIINFQRKRKERKNKNKLPNKSNISKLLKSSHLGTKLKTATMAELKVEQNEIGKLQINDLSYFFRKIFFW